MWKGLPLKRKWGPQFPEPLKERPKQGKGANHPKNPQKGRAKRERRSPHPHGKPQVLRV